jgi:hypothetical protein
MPHPDGFLASRLDHLFDAIRRPDGKPYTPADVAAVPGHVAHDKGAAVPGEGDDVEPVAADLGAGLGGDVTVARLKAGYLP